ncbi:expressed protein [Echinococcus multilocularis]|uniref:Expressed protein n=1 Tax=Echinococcus multilocularis TaxID=6211 RepID=A0A068Y189_ECHMU|nr:expressed protein [Echinococcus multilocularis]
MSLLHCLYVYGQWCRVCRRCLCALTTECSGGRGRNESEEEQREEVEEEVEEEDVDWSTSMTPPLSASLTTLTSPVLPLPSPLPSPICPSRLGGLDIPYSTCSISSFPSQLLAFIHHIHSPLLSHESPLHFLLYVGEEVGDVAEDMSIAAAGRSDEVEMAMMASYWETPSGDELSEFTTPSSPHHIVGAWWVGGGDGFSLTERTAHASAYVAFEEEEEGEEGDNSLSVTPLPLSSRDISSRGSRMGESISLLTLCLPIYLST